MHFSTISIIAALATTISAQCSCARNNDAGRWVDSRYSPADAVDTLTASGQCIKAETQGNICVNGDASKFGCLRQFARQEQSYHGDWFLWTAIQCEGLDLTFTA
ncbi:hypothetical protein CKM354_000091000 [Cercospora kikuchii]|uniref:Uncharacterized protein n=1 Tax=Cercospora kikuchii TaxID=84275 RepID=A0A9P3CCD2_9PEZI|nr:uncharacterized protein CKM354_000091000 [Cercospora kikuchii]GIZ37465.1 hypothetical protein CKM354_000091000 [Cercospora kikuchii]